jgi:hypothetical protein
VSLLLPRNALLGIPTIIRYAKSRRLTATAIAPFRWAIFKVREAVMAGAREELAAGIAVEAISILPS